MYPRAGSSSLFHGTAGFYAAFRPPVPARVADLIADEARLDGRARLLDVGSGTGQVLLSMADRFELAVGIEPDAEMLEMARRKVDDAGLTSRVVVEQGAAPDLPQTHAPYRLITFCRVFHWLDRAATLRAAMELLEPAGAVAIFGDGSFWTGKEDWQEVVRTVVQRWLGADRRAGTGRYMPPGERFEDALTNAGFASVRDFHVPDVRTWTADSILGYLHSTSFANRELFADVLPRFEQDLRDALRDHSGGDEFVEHATWSILLAETPPS